MGHVRTVLTATMCTGICVERGTGGTWTACSATQANSVAMDLYAYQNLSPEAQQHTKFAIKCIAHLLEQCIFAYLGMQSRLRSILFSHYFLPCKFPLVTHHSHERYSRFKPNQNINPKELA